MSTINSTRFSIKEEDTNIFPLNFSHLFFAFATLVFGWSLASLALVGELLIQKY